MVFWKSRFQTGLGQLFYSIIYFSVKFCTRKVYLQFYGHLRTWKKIVLNICHEIRFLGFWVFLTISGCNGYTIYISKESFFQGLQLLYIYHYQYLASWDFFFPFFTKSRDFTFSHSYISRTLYFFIMRIIFLESLDKKESFDILNSIVDTVKPIKNYKWSCV